jgi:hypothetical protein
MSQGLCESDVEETALDIFRILGTSPLWYEVAPGEQRIPCRQPVSPFRKEKTTEGLISSFSSTDSGDIADPKGGVRE